MNAGLGRNFVPEAPDAIPRKPWALWLGHDLEELYCHYVELNIFIIRGEPPTFVERIATLGRWITDTLQALDCPEEITEFVDAAIDGVTRRDDFYTAIQDAEWHATRAAVGDGLDKALPAARRVLPPEGRRYFDYGVMLARVALCSVFIHVVPKLPERSAALFMDSIPLYRRELRRAAETLIAFIENEDEDRPHDPRHRLLDQRFQSYREYLSGWLTRGADPGDDFFQRLHDIRHDAGLFSSGGDANAYFQVPTAPLSDAERSPLSVPHTATEREALEQAWRRSSDIAAQVEPQHHFLAVRNILDRCREHLGPVDRMTMHINLTLAFAHARIGSPETGVLMACDVTETARHYYGPLHPITLFVTTDAVALLRRLSPETAEILYNAQLRSLFEAPESDFPGPLRDTLRTLRSHLEVDPNTATESNDQQPAH